MVGVENMDKVNILIVEDERITATHTKKILEKFGYQVKELVASGEEAISKAEELDIDLVLMDINLQGKMDGIEAAEIIRNRFEIPIIFISAYSDEETIQRAKLTEPSGFLVKEAIELLNKPFDQNELQTTIEITLYRNRIEKRIREHERWLEAVLNSISDAVIATDSSRQIKFMNMLAENLTGWIEADAIGMEIQDIFQILDTESTLKKISEETVTVPIEHAILLDNEGVKNPIDGCITPIKDNKDNIEGLVVTFRPVK